MPKTNAKYCRDYRNKQKINDKIKLTPKTSTERVRAFRERQKACSSSDSYFPSTSPASGELENPKPSTSKDSTKAGLSPETTDWHLWCRLCAKNAQNSFVEHVNENIAEAISINLNVNITLDNGLSSNLCTECHDFLQEWIVFANHVHKVQQMFEVLQGSDLNSNADNSREPSVLDSLEANIEKDTQTEGEEYLVVTLERNDKLRQQEFVALEENQLGKAIEEQSVENIHTPDQSKKKRQPPAAPKSDLSSQFTNETPSKIQNKCQKCHKVYNHPSSLRKHMKICCTDKSKTPKVMRTCKVCGKTVANLSLHMRYMHENVRPYVCEVCGKGHKAAQDLSKHKLVHSDEKPFECEICKATFKHKERLKVHVETHGEAIYECDICGKKMKTRAIFNKHKREHAADRRFQCDICGAGFNYRTILKSHLISHTGLKPYGCKFCKKTYANKTNCINHQKKKHPKEVADKGGRGQSRFEFDEPSLEQLHSLASSIMKETETD